MSILQGTRCTGKTGKMAKKIPCQGKHREFGNGCQNTGKTQGIWFSQVCKSPGSKDKKYFDICHENLQKKLNLNESAKSVLCM